MCGIAIPQCHGAQRERCPPITRTVHVEEVVLPLGIADGVVAVDGHIAFNLNETVVVVAVEVSREIEASSRALPDGADVGSQLRPRLNLHRVDKQAAGAVEACRRWVQSAQRRVAVAESVVWIREKSTMAQAVGTRAHWRCVGASHLASGGSFLAVRRGEWRIPARTDCKADVAR